MNDIIGRYRIRYEVGKGSLGTVYVAEDLALGRNVALKVFSAEALHDPENFNTLMTEARILSALNHPNIVAVYEVARSGSSYFIASEHVQGENLRDRMSKEPLPLGQTLDIAIQVALALDAAHDAGVVHRDIKPENIMLRPPTFVKIIDFGVAQLSERRQKLIKEIPDLTKIREVRLPDLLYMSPEEVLGRDANRSTDIWRLGVLLSEMVSQRTPFQKTTISKTVDSILNDKPAKLTRDVPTDLERIITRALQKTESQRYGSAEQMASDLKALRYRVERATREGSYRRRTSLGRLLSRLRPHITTRRVFGLTPDDDAPDILYINLWLENEDKKTLSTPAVLTKDAPYMFMFAIEKRLRDDSGFSEPFVEPPELRDVPVTKVVIELFCPFLENGGETGYVRREVNYRAGVGFPPETFNLKPDAIGRFYLTARLLIKGETIYREVLSLEVMERQSNLQNNRADSMAAHA